MTGSNATFRFYSPSGGGKTKCVKIENGENGVSDCVIEG